MTTTAKLEVRILGCGSSGGVPRINGDWGVCDPNDPRNYRTRCSILVRKWGEGQETPTEVLVDTSPDMREQLIKAKMKRLDAVLYTHDHADQCHGIDDLRAVAYASQKRVPVHMDAATYDTLTDRFGYCFEGKGGYPAILDGRNDVRPGEYITVDGPGGSLNALAMDQDHGRIRSIGYRFGPISYCNDTVGLPPETMTALTGTQFLIVDALRYDPHPTHAHLSMALDWIKQIRPQKAILTNLHIDMDYEELSARLPDNVVPAYDGMVITTSVTD